MRPSALWYLYRRRLRAHALQELLAGVGIAAAVALVLAALVAEGSIVSSTREFVHAIVGSAQLQLRARGTDGFEERLLAKVEALPGVSQAAPLLERTNATLVAPGGHRATIDLAGTDTSLAVLDGLAHTLPLTALSNGSVGITRETAQKLGVPVGGRVTLKLRGAATPLEVSATLGPEAVGTLSHALVAVMPLEQMQQLTRLPGRISRILVRTDSGREAEVRGGLERIAAGRLAVEPADQDVRLVKQALRPSDQASALFAVIGALLGFLFAFNAMLLTAPERRQAIADLRLNGSPRRAIVQIVCFQAGCLALAASLPGLAAGYVLSRWVFHQSTGYLAEAFPLSPTTVIGATPIVIAIAVGLVATFTASAVPLLDLRRSRSRDAVFHERGVAGNALDVRWRRRMFEAALGLLGAASVLYALAPGAALGAVGALALATVLALPLVFALVLAAVRVGATRFPRLASAVIASASLRATTVRSLALAATGAVALFGSVALGGARSNLLSGIDAFARSYAADAAIWVGEPDDNQAANDFPASAVAARIARVPGVAGTSDFFGSFLVLGHRRVWVLARPPGGAENLLSSQLVQGRLAQAKKRLGEGGWVVLSKAITEEMGAHIGGEVELPTPSGKRRYKIAALSSNLAWPPGVVLMSAHDYRAAWSGPAPSALAVALARGASPPTVRRRIRAALGPSSGLEVSTARERERRIETLAGEGLGQLGEISTMLIVATVLTMAAALGSSINQRRVALSGLRLSGARPGRLRRILLLEATVMLGAGCATGAVVGVYGQLVIDRYLRHVTGFPVASASGSARPLEILAIVLGAALALAAVPGWLASRVSPALALREE